MAEGLSPAIVVLGAGSWGTALAILLARNGADTYLWGRNVEHVRQMRQQRCNARYLPGAEFPPRLTVVEDYAALLPQVRNVLLAVPSHGFRQCLETIAPSLRPDVRVAWATKGLEAGSHKLLHQVAAEVLGAQTPTALISGPTFAKEVALGLPTAVTVASQFPGFAHDLAAYLHQNSFRAYTCDDLIGVEIGGATKNVMAIAAGIADGLGFGANTRAALISRAMAEMMRLGEAAGGHRETLMGLAGLGDLVLTCTDNQSRNRRFGLALGRGKSRAEAAAEIDQVIEGIETAREIHALAASLGVEMPITEQVYRVLFEGATPREAVRALLEREQKAEVI